jgi:hypothetical protein
MTALELPAPDAPAEEWGRLAVSLPGWRWMAGMLGEWSLDDDPTMPLRLTEDASGGHLYVDNPVWSGVRSDREFNDYELDPEWCWPDPDDPATGGCLLELLGRPVEVRLYNDAGVTRYPRVGCLLSEGRSGHASTLGRACIAAAAALGRWPGGGA